MSMMMQGETNMYANGNQTVNATVDESVQDYELVAQAIRHLEENYREQPSLEELAAVVNVSPFHLQRVFTRWAGISPKRFVQYLTVEHAKHLLAEALCVLD
jgi:AraC family transcriptional regulator of adaptative response/methylated-DNA-[protein]-cysteine methyltransferase